MNRYCYQPLPPTAPTGRTPPFTRLLLLAAGGKPDPLVCSLTIVDIEHAPPFEALSYVWGQSMASDPIWCDGGFLQPKSNLDAALRSLRLPTQARRLWVDAVCIDQTSTEERSRQVSYMRLMYKHAARTVVWLGPESPGTQEVFNLAEMIAEIKSASSDNTSVNGANLLPESDIITEVFSAHPEAVEGLTRLFDGEYFMRIWCVQEVVVSSWCIAKCDHLEINFMDLLSTIIHVNMRRTSFVSCKPLEFWNMIYLLKQPGRSNLPRLSGHAIEGSVGSLHHLLVGTRDFKATDARDKIFSLLGISDEGLMPVLGLTSVMASDKNSLSMRFLRRYQQGIHSFQERVNELGPGIDFGRNRALKADYSKSAMEAYRDLTRFMMRKAPRVLDVLSLVQHTEDPPTDGFPSWVPKLFQPRSASMIGGAGCFGAGLCDGHFRYFANLHDAPLAQPSVRPNILSIEGYHVDQVRSVSDVIEFGLDQEMPIQAVWTQLFGTSFSSPSSSTYRDGDILQKAFCLTLMASFLGPVMIQGINLINHTPSNKAELVKQADANAAAYVLQYLDNSASPILQDSLRKAASAGSEYSFQFSAGMFSFNRRAYVTQNGLIGIGPKLMKEGDEICTLFGGRVPFVLRRMADHHLFIGETYIHDDNIMLGKLTEGVRFRNQLPTMTYDIR